MKPREAKRRGILVPVFLENVPAPLAFRLLSGADLSDWTYGTPHAEYDKLIERVAECLASPGPATEPRAAPVVPADQAAPAGEPHETRRLRTSDRLPPKPAGRCARVSGPPNRWFLPLFVRELSRRAMRVTCRRRAVRGK